MSKLIIISFAVGTGYSPGDYARLHGNSGSGAVDWNTPLLSESFDLFPGGLGIFGCGFGPCGHTRCGRAYSNSPNGLGHVPCGKGPAGLGANVIEASIQADECGDYKFAFAAYDAAGNLHEGTPEEITAYVHIAPAAPSGLTKYSYSKVTDILVLNAA